MNKLNDFVTKHFTKIVVIMLVVLFFRSCGDGGTKGLNKRIDALTEEVEVLENKIDARATTTDLMIEGLKAEKRMIQSTDRKMLDVTRQSVIDTEIEKLEKSK
jgi:hypothetical protein